jgi:signal transduction histidine kinase
MKILSRTIRGMDVSTPMKRDAILLPALFLFNSFEFSSWTQLGHVAAKPWLILVWLYGLIILIPLIWRDRAPLIVFIVQWVLAVATWPIMPYYTPMAGIPVALYAVSTHFPRRISSVALLSSFIPIGLDAIVAFRVYDSRAAQLSSFTQNAVFLILVAIGAWGSGRLTRASQRRVRRLEREHQMAHEAVSEERKRIARELHDIVSNAVAVMVLQATGATRVADTDFAAVKQSLANIETKGKQAMAELERLLTVLDDNSPAKDLPSAGRLQPQPGLADLTDLLTSFRATGRRIADHIIGMPRDVDPSIDLAAYRIVQEGLTNILRHASEHADPQLRLVWEAHTLIVELDNGTNLEEAHCGQPIPHGRGLVGLRERVHAVGGTLDAGPHRGGGYRLTATLPLDMLAAHPRASPATVSRAYS